MPTIIRPNFASAYSKANEILVSSRIISTFPFSPTALVKEQIGIPCRSYQKAAKYGVDMTAFGSESAIIMDLGGKQIIFYDKTKPESHINFSILHELGHPINGHDYTENDSDAYARYEVETNYFAAQLLMPEQILREFQKRGKSITISFLMQHFKVSATAAQKRIETLAKTNAEWRSRQEKQYDDLIVLRHNAFINAICPLRKNLFSWEDEYQLQLKRDSW